MDAGASISAGSPSVTPLRRAAATMTRARSAMIAPSPAFFAPLPRLPFELDLPVTAMFTAMQQLEQNLTAIEAAQIEAITRPSGSKKEPTPPPN